MNMPLRNACFALSIAAAFALTGCQTTDDTMDDTAPAPAEPASMDSTTPADSTTPTPTESTTPPPAGTPTG